MLVRGTLRVFVSASWGAEIPTVERLLDEIEGLDWWNVGARDGEVPTAPESGMAGAEVLLIPGVLTPAGAAVAEREIAAAALHARAVVAVAPLDERHRADEIIGLWRGAGIAAASWDARSVEEVLAALGVVLRGVALGRLGGSAAEGLGQVS